MQHIEQIYINGQFVAPHGQERLDLHNPATQEKIGDVRLGDVEDTHAAIAAAKQAFAITSRTTPAERAAWLRKLRDAVSQPERIQAMKAAMALEYGAPQPFIDGSVAHTAQLFETMAQTVAHYPFKRTMGRAEVSMEPLGVVAAITPWNSSFGFICSKMATAIAAGSSIVVKPSEMSAIQTQVLLEALHEAGLPPGVFNIVNGLGHVVGAEFSRHPDVAKISFTGSTATGRAILSAAAETFKRVTLELGGKGPQIVLDDADLDDAIPKIVMSGVRNSGQACIAGTRILVSQQRHDEVVEKLKAFVATLKVGANDAPGVQVGPMVSQKQWERVQGYIHLGLDEGATLLTGGEGKPQGLERGWFVRPTIFTGVRNDMRIAQEEIFGPVLCVIPYRDEAEAIEIANDTRYGLQSYVLSSDLEHARRVAAQLQAGRVVINDAPHEPLAPFGGAKQSGIGREYGEFGLDAFLEPKAVLLP